MLLLRGRSLRPRATSWVRRAVSVAADPENGSSSSVLVDRIPIPHHNAGYMVVTLNRPKQSNALDVEMLQDLQGVFDTLPGYV